MDKYNIAIRAMKNDVRGKISISVHLDFISSPTSTELLTSTNAVDCGYLITAKVCTNESFYKQPELLPSLFMLLLFQISKCCKN